MTCNRYAKGDKGQRFEVRGTRKSTGEVEVCGWTELPNGGTVLKMFTLNPAFPRAIASAIFVDRFRFGKHAAFNDGLDNRCLDCRKEMRTGKKKGASTPHKSKAKAARISREERMPLPMRPAPKPNVDDADPDFDPDEDMPNPFSRVASAPPAAPPATLKVACETCGEKFNDAKSCGIHKTRVHFGR